jgi:SAM-dependent methyltransferase
VASFARQQLSNRANAIALRGGWHTASTGRRLPNRGFALIERSNVEKESAYIAAQRMEQEAAEAWLRELNSAAEGVYRRPAAQLPPLPLMNKIGSFNEEHFRANSVAFFKEIASRLRISRDAAVLDLGCGCGRMAIPFIDFLRQGRFYGCDVWDEGIRWCNENLTSAGNAEFFVQPAPNNYYFADFDGSKKNNFRLDWLADGALDASYAISVFTHLIQEDVADYLGEIARGTKVGGLGYFTFFIADKYFWSYREKTGNHLAIRESEDGCHYAYSGQDFFGAYSMDALKKMFDVAGWDIVSFELGSWAHKPGSRNYQDTFILERRA